MRDEQTNKNSTEVDRGGVRAVQVGEYGSATSVTEVDRGGVQAVQAGANDSTASATEVDRGGVPNRLALAAPPAADFAARGARTDATEDAIDGELLRWVARFRFVTAEVLALHLGVTRQRAQARARRLEQEGFLHRSAALRQQAYTLSVTARGMRRVGLQPRRPPKTDVQREHELALAWLVTKLERQSDVIVRTERDSRRLESEANERYSADVVGTDGRVAKRWPDLIVERGGRRTVLELERTLKGAARLRRIVEAYRAAAWFDEVRIFCADPDVARSVASAALESAPAPDEPEPAILARSPRVVVLAWPGLRREARRDVEDALRAADPFLAVT